MSERTTWFREILARNKGVKLTSLFLAIAAWYAIQAVISHETLIQEVPLTIKTDEGWAILDASAKTVDVVFRGSRDDIRFLNRDQVKIEVDIRGQQALGSSTIRLGARNVNAPGAVRPIHIRPSEINLSLDQEGEKQVPVKVDLQGAPPEGFEVEKVVCNPATVVLNGPRQRFDEIQSVRTAPIDLEGRSRTFKKTKHTIVPPSENWVGRISPQSVEVEVTIVERAAVKEVQDLPISVLIQPGPRPRLDIWPSKVNVTVRGRAELLKNLQRSDIETYIDCSSLQTGASYELPVKVHAFPGLSAVSIDPAVVKVTIGEL